MRYFNRLIIPLAVLLTGCAGTREPPPPEVSPAPEAPKVQPVRKAAPAKPVPAPAAPQAPAAQPSLSDKEVRELVTKLLPTRLKDKDGWAGDLQNAFRSLQIQPRAENFCAVIAVIEQESSFQADPVVPGLPGIIRREIDQRRDKYGIPQTVIDWMLTSASRDGRTYQQRIDALRTEKELSDLVEEIVDRVPSGSKLFPNYNPVRTGGPMQVSVEFAEAHARARPYPYQVNGSLRNEVFSRRGGVYFGSAILLDYPAPYDGMLYRFADFNAGRYSSRNAAFQYALAKVSGKALATDGDLLRYKNGAVAPEPSATLEALDAIGGKLQMSDAEIERDLRQEKLSTFARTQLYARLFALADKGGTLPRVAMPQIDLKSPKIHRQLTTEWFANRVYGRYANCLKQGGITAARLPAQGKAGAR